MKQSFRTLLELQFWTVVYCLQVTKEKQIYLSAKESQNAAWPWLVTWFSCKNNPGRKTPNASSISYPIGVSPCYFHTDLSTRFSVKKLIQLNSGQKIYCLWLLAFESALSLSRFPEEISRADKGKSQWHKEMTAVLSYVKQQAHYKREKWERGTGKQKPEFGNEFTVVIRCKIPLNFDFCIVYNIIELM